MKEILIEAIKWGAFYIGGVILVSFALFAMARSVTDGIMSVLKPKGGSKHGK